MIVKEYTTSRYQIELSLDEANEVGQRCGESGLGGEDELKQLLLDGLFGVQANENPTQRYRR